MYDSKIEVDCTPVIVVITAFIHCNSRVVNNKIIFYVPRLMDGGRDASENKYYYQKILGPVKFYTFSGNRNFS